MAFNKEKVMEAARKFVDKGQTDKAIKEYLRVVKEDPQDVRVWLKIGDLYAKKGSKQEASETYLKVARFYQDQGFFLKAVAVYKQILKLDPRLVEVNLKLAELYRQLGLLSDAMQHFESVAAHFHREGKTKEALATVRQLVDLDPENIATRIKLAELYSKEQMTAEAVSEFQVACDQLRKQARVDDFVKVAERLLWHKADNLPLNRELAVLYLRRNDPRRALQKLQACFKADPRDVETLALLAQAFQALDQKSKTVSVLKELARVFEENKKRDKAEEVHRKILQFVPNDPDSLAFLGDRAPAARASQPKMIPTVTPPPPSSGRGTGGNPRLNFTSEVAAIGSPPASRMTGSMPLVQAPDFELPEYDEVAAEAPDHEPGDLSEELALDEVSYHGQDSSAAGEEHAEEIAKILTETDVYIKYGLHQKAIDHLRRVFALDAENLEARERLKDVLLSQGREREAIAELMHLAESCASHDPDRAEIYLREVLAVDGTYKPAFDLARRFKLEVAADRPSGSEGEIDLDSDALHAGAIAPVEDDLDLDDIDFNDARAVPRPPSPSRADSFDGIDPAMFAGGGHHRVGAADVRAIAGDATRQVAAREVEALAAMSSAPRALEFEDGVIETPPPPVGHNAVWTPPARSLDDVLEEHLDDALADDIDQDVAAELAQAPGYVYEAVPADANGDFELPSDEGVEDLPFDPDEAREFDLGLRPGQTRAPARVDFEAPPPTFDPAAAAAFDADSPSDLRDLRHANPSAADLGAAPAERFDSMGFHRQPALEVAEEDVAEEDVAEDVPADYDEPGYVHDAGDVGEPSSTIDVGQDELEALAQGYDPNYTVDGPVEPAESPHAFAGPTVDAAYDEGFSASTRPPSTLEDELDEVDFYVSQDMLVEAADLLHTLLARHPGHPLISAKLRDVESSAGGYVAEGFARGPSVAEVGDEAIEEEAEADLEPVHAELGGTENIDLEEIEEVEPEDDLGEAVLEEHHEPEHDEHELEVEMAPEHDDVPVAKPKSKKPAVVLEKPIDDGDAETHYDLGLAYKEMGLYDEAVKAFEKLSSTSARAVQCRLMIGLCRREQGNYSEAVQAFKAGLHAAQVNEREKQSLYYEIGISYEAMGDAREALYYFEMVTKRDPSFLDAGDRITRLRTRAGRKQANEDSDSAVDALIDEI